MLAADNQYDLQEFLIENDPSFHAQGAGSDAPRSKEAPRGGQVSISAALREVGDEGRYQKR